MPSHSQTRPWNVAWIIGASTGIGKDLATQLASMGIKTAITARTESTLRETAASHMNLHAFSADTTDITAITDIYQKISTTLGPPDLVVMNAAIWDPMSVDDYTATRAIRSMEVNYGGVCNALQVILPAMKQNRSGHIAIVASVAGYRGLSRALAYAPTKAALINLSEALNLELRSWNVKVSVINPGFVDTPMTAQNQFPMPFIVSSDHAARKIVDGLIRGRFEIAFPWQLVTILKIARILPYKLFFPIMRKALNL